MRSILKNQLIRDIKFVRVGNGASHFLKKLVRNFDKTKNIKCGIVKLGTKFTLFFL